MAILVLRERLLEFCELPHLLKLSDALVLLLFEQ
jgi:hypothetical protein